MEELNEGAILHNLRLRYDLDQIYVSASHRVWHSNDACVIAHVVPSHTANLMNRTICHVSSAVDLHLFNSHLREPLQAAAHLLTADHERLP